MTACVQSCLCVCVSFRRVEAGAWCLHRRHYSVLGSGDQKSRLDPVESSAGPDPPLTRVGGRGPRSWVGAKPAPPVSSMRKPLLTGSLFYIFVVGASCPSRKSLISLRFVKQTDQIVTFNFTGAQRLGDNPHKRSQHAFGNSVE